MFFTLYLKSIKCSGLLFHDILILLIKLLGLLKVRTVECIYSYESKDGAEM